MMSFCQVTGMRHHFDKATHRCRCGRWENGFKPKGEPVRPRMECQICEREQATDVGGCMVHHGYKRPGWGCIVGDCMGVGHKPYPETDALVKYLEVVKRYIVNTQTALVELPNVTEMPFHWEERIDRERVKRTTMVKKGEPTPTCGNYCVTPFESLVRYRQQHLEQEIKHATREQARVEARIAKAKEDA